MQRNRNQERIDNMNKPGGNMKKISFLGAGLFFFAAVLGAEVVNEDRPLKGEWNFAPRKIWETSTAGEEVLTRLSAIRTDRKDNIYVFDIRHARFFVFSPDGQFRYAFGRKGEGPGEYRMAFTFFVLEERIIVPDMNRILFFDTRGNFIRSRIPGGSYIFPRTFVDRNRFVYVPAGVEENQADDQVKLVDLETGKQQLLFEIPAEKMLAGTVESGGNQMRLNIKDSNTTPGVIIACRAGDLYLGKNDEYRIRKMDLRGNEELVFSIEGRQRNPITLETKRKRLEGITFNGGRMPEAMIRQMINAMPDRCTHFNRLWVDANGHVYVFISDLADDTVQKIDIFSPGGRYLYRANLGLPESYRMDPGTIDFTDRFLYVFAEDEEGEGRLVKYQVRPVPASNETD